MNGLRYFLAALGAGPAGLEKIPVFFLTGVALLALCLLHSVWWAAALPVPLLAVFMLAANPRFRKVIDGRSAPQPAPTEDEYETLSSQIKLETRSRLGILERKTQRILDKQQEGGVDVFVLDANRDTLRQLRLIFARLLLTRQQILTEDFEAQTAKVTQELGALRAGKGNAESDAHRESLQETERLLEERLENLANRERKVAELDSDLKRIEAHFDLALSQAADRDRPQGITSDIGLMSEGLHGDLEMNNSEEHTTTAPVLQ